MRFRPRPWTPLVTLLAPLSWGTTYVTVTELLPDGRPLLVATMRVLPAGLALLVIGRMTSPWRPRGAALVRTALLSVCNFGLFFPLLIVAVYRLPGGVAAAVGGLQPLLVLVVSLLVLGRRPRLVELFVGTTAALGVAMVVVRPDTGIDALGVCAAVAANVSFSIGVVLTKRFGASPNRLADTGWQLLLSGALLAPLTLLVEGPPPPLHPLAVAGFAYLSLGATALAFLLWFDGVRRLSTASPPLLGLAAPLTGAALGWLLLGESLSWMQLLGFAVTVAAVAYGVVLRAPPATPPVVPPRAAAALRVCPASCGVAPSRH